MRTDFWLAVFAMAGATYLTRSATLLLFPHLRLPHALQRGLRYVPAGVLAALVLPALVAPGGEILLPWANPNLLAGILAGAAALRTGSVPLTMLTGVVSVLLFRWWMG